MQTAVKSFSSYRTAGWRTLTKKKKVLWGGGIGEKKAVESCCLCRELEKNERRAEAFTFFDVTVMFVRAKKLEERALGAYAQVRERGNKSRLYHFKLSERKKCPLYIYIKKPTDKKYGEEKVLTQSIPCCVDFLPPPLTLGVFLKGRKY